MNITPFKGLRPVNSVVTEIIAPPYDVIDAQAAREFVRNKPHNFLHVSKAEIDLSENTDPYSDQVYQKAKTNFAKLITEGLIEQDTIPCFYLYRLTQNNHQQTGIVAGVACQDYRDGLVKIHEHTRALKETDRFKHLEAVGAHTGPVILTFKDHDPLTDLIEKLCHNDPSFDVTASDGVRHQLWAIDEQAEVKQLIGLTKQLPALYVADGHHRCAAAAKLLTDPNQTFLAVLFPQSELQTLGYHRIIKDLNGLTPDEMLVRLSQHFDVTPSKQPVLPKKFRHFGLVLGKQWYQLALKDTIQIKDDLIAQLDVTQLTEYILTPILNITDMRNDPRIDYLGGEDCIAVITSKMSQGEIKAAFTLAPTPVTQIMAIADHQGIMPPKSTWFEPKLADGLIFAKI